MRGFSTRDRVCVDENPHDKPDFPYSPSTVGKAEMKEIFTPLWREFHQHIGDCLLGSEAEALSIGVV